MQPCKSLPSAKPLSPRPLSRWGTDRCRTTSSHAIKDLGSGLLDYIEAGPKLRKWYGKGQREEKKDGPEKDPEEESSRDSILVADADSPMGELVLLQLICARLKVIALVGSTEAAKNAYGSYVKPVSGSLDDPALLKRILQSAQAVIFPGKIGAIPAAIAQTKAIHSVLLSSVGSSSNGAFSLLLNGEQRVLSNSKREDQVLQLKSPVTVIRVDKIIDTPGGYSNIQLSQVRNGEVPQGEISREDLAQLLVRALGMRPKAAVTYCVRSSLASEQFKGWNELFAEST